MTAKPPSEKKATQRCIQYERELPEVPLLWNSGTFYSL